MTAKELISLLKEQPPEIKVVIRGYEEGYNDIQQLKILKLRQYKCKMVLWGIFQR